MAGKKKVEEDSDDIDDLVARDVAAVKAGVKDPPADDGDDDDGIVVDEEEPAKPSRAERRQERGRDFVREAQDRADAAERRAQAAEQRAQEAYARAIPAVPEKPSDAQAEVDKAYADQQSLYGHYNAARQKQGGITAEEHAEFEKRGREVELRKVRAIARLEGGGQRGPSVEDVVRQIRQQEIVEAHNDVITNPAAYRWAHAAMGMAVAEGKPDNARTLEDVMEHARTKFGMASRRATPAASDAMKRKMGGISRGGGSGRSESVRTIVPTEAEKRMANEMYSHLPKNLRLATWARKVGKKLVDEGGR